MFMPERVTFDDLSDMLIALEKQHGYSTIACYQRYQRGELGDDDELMEWMGLFWLYLSAVAKGQPPISPPFPAKLPAAPLSTAY